MLTHGLYEGGERRKGNKIFKKFNVQFLDLDHGAVGLTRLNDAIPNGFQLPNIFINHC